ncbi:MAG: antitoxin [Planctomycetota bacterium]
MSRISIDVTPEEHARLKALAALQGKSIKEFVLDSTLGLADQDGALAELEALLDRRLANARAGGLSKRSVDDVIAQVKREHDDTGRDA